MDMDNLEKFEERVIDGCWSVALGLGVTGLVGTAGVPTIGACVVGGTVTLASMIFHETMRDRGFSRFLTNGKSSYGESREHTC